MSNTKIKERGAASVKIALNDGVITVKHGTDNVTLVEWVARQGDWDRLWATIYTLRENSKNE